MYPQKSSGQFTYVTYQYNFLTQLRSKTFLELKHHSESLTYKITNGWQIQGQVLPQITQSSEKHFAEEYKRVFQTILSKGKSGHSAQSLLFS